MLIIPVKEGESIDKAIKRFKRKFDKTGKLKSLRERQAFTKPSVKHRNKIRPIEETSPAQFGNGDANTTQSKSVKLLNQIRLEVDFKMKVFY